MGLFSFLRKKSSLDKVREELQILNKKLSTSMSFLEVEEEIQFLRELDLGPTNDYSIREKHYKNVVTFWFKGLLAEHELLVVKKVIQPFGKDETVKAYLQFIDCFRQYLVSEGLLKDKKNSGGIQTTLDELYMKTFKSYEEEKNKDEKEDDKKEKKKPVKKGEEKTDTIENNENKLDGLRREKEESLGSEKELSEDGESKEGPSKESISSSESKEGPSKESLSKGETTEKVGPETQIADKAQKIALGVNNKEQSNQSKSLDNDSNEAKKEETIQGRNAYNVLTERLNQIQGERAELETQKMKMENFMEKNKDFMKELKDWRRENDRRLLNENRERNQKALNQNSKEPLKDSKDGQSKDTPKKESIFDKFKRRAKEGMAKHNAAMDKLFNREPKKEPVKEQVSNEDKTFKMEKDFGAEYRDKLEQVRLAKMAEMEYERNRAEAFKALGKTDPEKTNIQVELKEDRTEKVAQVITNKHEEPPVLNRNDQLVK